MPLNQLQQAAVSYLEGPLLVLAGPGTGKTQLLSAKVAHILKHTDANPENILCLTFTEAGASNMRNRLFAMIGRAANQVNIHTYHAFGSDLLSKYQHYATNPKRHLEQPIDMVQRHRITRELIDSLPPFDILKHTSPADIISTIDSAKSARLSAADLAKIATFNLAQTEKLNPKLNHILQNLQPRMKFELAISEVYRPILEVLAEFSSDQPITNQIEPEANFLLRELNQLVEQQLAAEKPSIKILTDWKTKTFEREDDGSYRLKNLVANKKLLSLSQIMSDYDQYLNDHHLFDFPDMIEEAIKTLKTDPGFKLTLSEQYQYILLDEFQDTNPSQFELIRLLTNYENPLVMAVGDDDQAIFAFQGANASNLLDFQKAYQAKIITLIENYRSTNEILNFSHQIATQITDSFAKNHQIDKNLRSMREKEILAQGADLHFSSTSQTNITRHEFLTADEEYHWVAAQINQLIKNGEEQSKIAIITPKHKYIPALLPYLKQHPNLNVAYEKRENILTDPKIEQLLLLARFIYSLQQATPTAHQLLQILSFPFWQIPPLTVITELQQSKSSPASALEYLQNSKHPQLQLLAHFFATLATTSVQAPLELFLDQLIGTAALQLTVNQESLAFSSPYLQFYSQSSDQAETFILYENLTVLREQVLNYTGTSQPRLADFIRFLDDYEAAGQAILNTSPYQDAHNSVQILTAHKSKGLEYRHVFLIATDNLSWGNAKGNNNLLTLPKNLISIRHTGITDDERLRLFFVAITRAEKTLTITNAISDYSGKTPERLSYLGEYQNEAQKLISPLLPEPEVYCHNEDLPITEKLRSLKNHWLSAYQIVKPELKPLLQKQLENYRLTATDLTTFIDIIHAGPMQFYQRRILKAPSEPASATLCFGNLMHATFEAVTSSKLSDEEALAFFKTEAATQPLSPTEISKLITRGEISLKVALPTFKHILRHPHAKAEVNLYHEHLTLDQIPLTGKIDHLHLDPKTKTLEIYDFKTSSYKSENWSSDATLYKYALQLEFYKLLLNLSPTYRHYQINQAHILFVTPDPVNQSVYDKVYEFTPASGAKLQALAKAVYRHIQALDFITPDSPLALHPDSTRNLRDIQQFINLILDKS